MKRFADCHIHIGDNLDLNDNRARKMFNLMADLGVTDGSLLAYGPANADPISGKNYRHIVQNHYILYHKHTFDRIKLRAFGWIYDCDEMYANIPAEHQLERLYELGIDGVKFLNMKPNFRKYVGMGINNPYYDKALSMMEERGTPVLIHSGDPEHFWDMEKATPDHIAKGWCYGDGTYLTLDQLHAECYEMLDKHPKLNVTFAHFLFLSHRMDEARRVMEKYPNVKLDLTPNTYMYTDFSKKIDEWRDFFIEYQDRILFGTDADDYKPYNDALHNGVYSALTHDRSEFELGIYFKPTVRGLELPESVVDKICYGNFAKFAGESTAPVNTELLVKTAEKIISDVKDEPACAGEIKWLSELSSKI